MKRQGIDFVRIIAVIVVVLGIIYFYLNLFVPKHIPFYFRAGMPTKRLNILLMGTDLVYARETHQKISEWGRTDTLILVSINPVGGKINLLSIPRDTLAEIPGYGRMKINSAHFIGGPKLAEETVSNLLGIPIDRYVLVHPSGIIELIDVLGGIRIYVDKDMYYVDNAQGLYVNLKKGWHALSGKEANGYLRFRQDPLGDINRVQRQQSFIGALFNKLANPASIARAPLIIGTVRESVKTDLSLSEIIRITNLARCLNTNDFKSTLLPGSFSTDPTLPCFWIPNMPELEKILVEHFNKAPSKSVNSSSVSDISYVTIYNNTNDERAIIPILRKLYNTKYVVSNTVTIRRDDLKTTRIIAQRGDDAAAKALGDLLKIQEVVVSGTGDVTSDFTVILNEDYKN